MYDTIYLYYDINMCIYILLLFLVINYYNKYKSIFIIMNYILNRITNNNILDIIYVGLYAIY